MTALSPESHAALLEAECRLASGSLEQAAECLEHTAQRSSDAALLCALGALQLLLGRDARAHHWLRRALCFDPADALCRHLYALVLWKIGRLREAAAQLRVCLESAPLDVDLLMALSAVSREIGDAEEACQAQDRALQAHPRDADVWAAAGLLALSLGQSESAIMAYRAALTLSPGHAGARAALARIPGQEACAGRRAPA